MRFIVILMLFHGQVLRSSANLRFLEPIQAGDFFRQCRVSDTLSDYCNPEFNLAVSQVYVGCGARHDLEDLARDPRLRFAEQFDARAFFGKCGSIVDQGSDSIDILEMSTNLSLIRFGVLRLNLQFLVLKLLLKLIRKSFLSPTHKS